MDVHAFDGCMEFVNVKSVTIPEGDVKRIVETLTGRVLWEKAPDKAPFSFGRTPTLEVAGRKAITTSSNVNILYLSRWEKSTSNYPMCAFYRDLSTSTAYLSDGGTVAPRIDAKSAGSYVLEHTGQNTSEYADRRIEAVSDMIDADSHTGLVMTRGIDATTGGLTNDYYFVRLNGYHYPTTGTAFKKMDSKPQTEGQVYITYAKERDEFLVTGLNKGSCVVPADMTSGTSITYETSGLKRAYWVASYNRYYGVTGTNGNLLTSLSSSYAKAIAFVYGAAVSLYQREPALWRRMLLIPTAHAPPASGMYTKPSAVPCVNAGSVSHVCPSNDVSRFPFVSVTP